MFDILHYCCRDWLVSSHCISYERLWFACLLRSVLTVACEQTEVLLFDPISSRHIKTLTEAHEDCVNNIRCVCHVLNHPETVLKRKQAHPASTSRTGPRIKDSGWQHDALNHLLNMPDEAREQTWRAEANKKLLDFRFMSVEDVKCSTDWLTDCALQVFGQSFVCHLLWRHHDCIMGSAQAELKGLLVARPRQLGEEHRVRHQHSAPRHVWLRRQRHHVGH